MWTGRAACCVSKLDVSSGLLLSSPSCSPASSHEISPGLAGAGACAVTGGGARAVAETGACAVAGAGSGDSDGGAAGGAAIGVGGAGRTAGAAAMSSISADGLCVCVCAAGAAWIGNWRGAGRCAAMFAGGSLFGEWAVATGKVIEGLIKGGGMAAGGGALVVLVPGTEVGAMLSVAAAAPAASVAAGSEASVLATSVALAPASLASSTPARRWGAALILSAATEPVWDSAAVCVWLRSSCEASDSAPGICIGTLSAGWDCACASESTAGGVVTGRGEIRRALVVEM